MIVPLPFSRAIFVYGDPITIPRDGNVEEWRERVAKALDELADSAERDFDRLWEEV